MTNFKHQSVCDPGFSSGSYRKRCRTYSGGSCYGGYAPIGGCGYGYGGRICYQPVRYGYGYGCYQPQSCGYRYGCYQPLGFGGYGCYGGYGSGGYGYGSSCGYRSSCYQPCYNYGYRRGSSCYNPCE